MSLAEGNRLPLDNNRRPVLGGVSYLNSAALVDATFDPATGAQLVTTVGNALVTAPLVGQSKVAVTGTAVRLNGGTSQALSNGLIISAPSGNAAVICIGGSGVNNTSDGTGNGYLLAAGASVSFAVGNTNDIYINGTSGDFVSWAGS